MSKYTVTGPIKIKYKNGSRGVFLDETNITEFWENTEAEKIRKSKGCYIFGIRAGRGITPYYVGKTSRDFEKECFADHKRIKYHEALSKGKGSPVMFFVAHPKQRGKTNGRQISEIEEFLIKLQSARNEDHLNKNGSKREDWKILGITGGRKPSASAKTLKKMLGIYN